MTTQSLVQIPKAETVREPKKDKYGNNDSSWYQITPYEDNRWQEKIAELGVSIPFKEIITVDMGKSQCADCGAVYEGHSPAGCSRIVYKTDPEQKYYSSYKFSHKFHPKNKTERCGGIVKWSLQKEFDDQKDFFSFLAMICNTVNTDWFDKYKHVIPAERIDEFRIKTLLFELMETQRKTQEALNQIASKMHNAGVSLQF